jgi:hypothetical protein
VRAGLRAPLLWGLVIVADDHTAALTTKPRSSA